MFYVGKMPKNPAISKATRNAILDAAWTLTVERQSLDLTQAEICRAAGVTRQTVYLAFGGLPGILDAMLDRQDEGSAELREMIALRERERPETEDFWRYIRLWLAYLPRIYPVAILLDAAARTDPSAARAYRTRMHDRFRAGLRRLLDPLARGGRLREGLDPEVATDIVWSQVHPTSWRLLVEERGWPPQEFGSRQEALIRAAILRF